TWGTCAWPGRPSPGGRCSCAPNTPCSPWEESRPSGDGRVAAGSRPGRLAEPLGAYAGPRPRWRVAPFRSRSYLPPGRSAATSPMRDCPLRLFVLLRGFLDLVGQHVGHDAHLRSELERHLPASVERQLDEERSPTGFGLGYLGDVNTGFDRV